MASAFTPAEEGQKERRPYEHGNSHEAQDCAQDHRWYSANLTGSFVPFPTVRDAAIFQLEQRAGYSHETQTSHACLRTHELKERHHDYEGAELCESVRCPALTRRDIHCHLTLELTGDGEARARSARKHLGVSVERLVSHHRHRPPYQKFGLAMSH